MDCAMLIRLEFKETHLYEIDSARFGADIEIGRSSQCAWRVPVEDKDVSSRHARLSCKGNTVTLEDLGSSNGTFYRGRKIAKLKLKPGMRLSIGNCLLVIDEGGGGGPVEVIPELVLLAGRNRGQRREIKPGTFTIGSDPGSSLCLLDMLVSRNHAEIVFKEDKSCWIKDLGSKNGTTVNDTPLKAGQERLLKEGDKLTFAQFEARFHDGTAKRSNQKVWLRLGIMVGTIVVVLALFALYQRVKPSAGSYLGAARSAAAAERFDEARKAMDKAAQARGAEARELELSDLSRLVNVWEATLKSWTSARESLAGGDWVAASRDLGLLYTLKPEAWTWRPDAADERTAALRAKAMLDTLLHASGALRGEETAGSTMRGELEAVKKALADNAGQLPDYLAKARTELVELQGKLDLFLAESRELESALDSLAQWPAPYDRVVSVLEETVRNSRGLLKRRSELMLDPVRALSRSQQALDRAVRLAHDLQFEQALQVPLELPSTSACALDSRVSSARAAIEAAETRLHNQVNQLTYLFREVGKYMPDPEAKSPPAMQAWQDREALNRMLNGDSLYRPMPRRSRKEPSGDYDRYLGIEEFYEFLSAVALHQPWREKSDAPFPTVVAQTRGAIDAIEAIRAFFEKEEWAVRLTAVNTTEGITRLDDKPSAAAAPTNAPAATRKDTQWLLAGRLAARVAELQDVLKQRDELQAALLRIASENEDRPALIAAGIAYRLAEDPARLKIKDEPLEKHLVRCMQENRTRLRELIQQYDLAAPAQQLPLRDQIIKLGLPGDPIVKRMWSSSTATQ